MRIATTFRAGLPSLLALGCALVIIGRGPAAGWLAVPAVPAGLALTLALPGWAVVALLFPSRSGSLRTRGANRVERAVLVPALSLAGVVLGGLALNAAGVRLDATSWAVLAAGLTIVANVPAIVRSRRAVPAPEAPRPEEPRVRAAGSGAAPPAVPGRRVLRATGRLLPIALAAVLLAGAGWLSVATATQHQATAFTALSMVRVPTDGKRVVRIEVQLEERRGTPFVIEVTGPDGYRSALSGRLEPGRTWSDTLAVPADGRITADLYLTGAPGQVPDGTPYRTVYLSDQS